MPLLRIDDIHLSFGGVKAINGVSINVDKGCIHAIIGPNGAGKTRSSTASPASTSRSAARSTSRAATSPG